MKVKKSVIWMGIFVLATILCVGNATKSEAKKQKSLSKAKITLSKTKYTYDGKAKKPKVTVKIGKKKLKKNKDYTVQYSKNKKPGTAKVTVKAKKSKKAKYSGSKKKTFKIVKASRKIVPGKSSYSAIEGDGAFQITAKTSKGKGTITYSCSTSNVIKISKTGKVTIVKKFDKTCKNLSKETKDTIKKATAKVKISVPATSCYKAASKTVTVTINKKSARAVDTTNSIRNFAYSTLHSSQNDSDRVSLACDVMLLKDMDWSIAKFPIPGLGPTADDDWIHSYVQCNNLCPQGICVAGDYLLTSAYCMDGLHNSCIVIYNLKTGAYLNTLVLKDQKSHVGGITFDKKNQILWICHSKRDKTTGLYSLQKITYSDLKRYAAGTKSCVLSSTAQVQTIPTKPSSIAYCEKDGYLWVAQFSDKSEKTNSEEEEEEEETDDDVTNEPKMYAYEYKNNKLKQVRQLTTDNTATQDYFSVTTQDEQITNDDKTERTAVVVKDTYSDDFQKGDIFETINGEQVVSSQQLEEMLQTYEEEDVLTVVISRNGNRMPPINIALGVRGEPLYRMIPTYVQGVTFTKEGDPIFSCSYGRNKTKKVFISELWVCKYDENNSLNPQYIVKLPPMIEEVEMINGEVYMIFESAATTYLEGTDGKGQSTCPIDKIVSLKLK